MAGSNWFQAVTLEEGVASIKSKFKMTSLSDSIWKHPFYQIKSAFTKLYF